MAAIGFAGGDICSKALRQARSGRESVGYCVGMGGCSWEGLGVVDCGLVFGWLSWVGVAVVVGVCVDPFFVISTAVILNGGYNYTNANVYTQYINQPHGKGARGACVSRKEHTPHEAPIFIYNPKKRVAFCGATLSKRGAARYRSSFGVYSIVLKTLLFFCVSTSRDRPSNPFADVAFRLPTNTLIVEITYCARHSVC